MRRMILPVLIVLLLVGWFTTSYVKNTAQLRSEYDRLSAEKVTLQQEVLAMAELSKKFNQKTDVSTFTETLYRCARQAKVDDHEVTTRLFREEALRRGERSRDKGTELKVQRFDVVQAGTFSQVAEYIQCVQNLDLNLKITRLALLPEEKSLKATMTLDLYSLGDAHVP